MRSKISERALVQANCPHIIKIIKKDSPLAKIESSSFKVHLIFFLSNFTIFPNISSLYSNLSFILINVEANY
jgi:hypothetical protein